MTQENESVTQYLARRAKEDIEGYEWTPRNVAGSILTTICAIGLLLRYFVHSTVYAVREGDEPDESYDAYPESPVGATGDTDLIARALTMSVAGTLYFMFSPGTAPPYPVAVSLAANWWILALDLPILYAQEVLDYVR